MGQEWACAEAGGSEGSELMGSACYVFVCLVPQPLVQQNPRLKVVMEHITTEEGARFVQSCGDNVAATITPQHLLYNRNGEAAASSTLPIMSRGSMFSTP